MFFQCLPVGVFFRGGRIGVGKGPNLREARMVATENALASGKLLATKRPESYFISLDIYKLRVAKVKKPKFIDFKRSTYNSLLHNYTSGKKTKKTTCIQIWNIHSTLNTMSRCHIGNPTGHMHVDFFKKSHFIFPRCIDAPSVTETSFKIVLPCFCAIYY